MTTPSNEPRRTARGPSREQAAWAAAGASLAQWTEHSLVNRDDYYGRYLHPRSRQEGKTPAVTRKGRLTSDLLRRHFAGTVVLGLLTTDSEGRCRWAVIDIDRHGDEGTSEANEKAAIALYSRVTQLGCSCLLEDSNGRGGFHLWIIFSEPIPASTLHRFAKGLVRDWHQLGLQAEPEVFPKQKRLKVGKIGNWMRLPGRHHTLQHWSRIWDGESWLAGEEAVEKLRSTCGSEPTVIPAESQQATSDAASSPTRSGDDRDDKPRLLGLARSALDVLPAEYCDNYDQWIHVGMSLRTLDEEGLALWDEWSRRSRKYEQGVCQQKWASFSPDGGLVLGSLFGWAEQNGWQMGSQPTPCVGPPSTHVIDSRAPRNRSLPLVLWGGQSLHKVTDAVLDAIRQKNHVPQLFQCNELLVRLRRQQKTGALAIELLTPHAFRGYLDRIANWCTFGDDCLVNTPPPFSIVKDIMHLPGWDPAIIPVLERVTETPIFAADGRLIDTPGYDAQAHIFYDPPAGLDIPPVSRAPAELEVTQARCLFFGDLFKDFPFKNDQGASKAHALAALLLHFVRDMIDGPTPLHLIDAAKPGTGKGLLADVIVIPATGREAETTPPPRSEEEMRKAITAALLEGPSHITLDNLSGELDSAALANCLTSSQWSDRVLGASKKAHLSIYCTWLATGNNVKLSTEHTRRTVWIRLESPLERPWERNPAEFTHHPLQVWAREHRGELIWAALTLIQNWIAKGRPAGSKTLGRFESWASVMGGILEAAQITGLMANAEDLYAATDETADEWRALTQAWLEEFGDAAVGTKDLFPIVEDKKLLPSVVFLEEEGDKARKKFGKALAKQVGSCYGGLQIVAAGKRKRDGTRLYKLVSVGSDDGTAEPVSNLASTGTTEENSGLAANDTESEWSDFCHCWWYYSQEQVVPLEVFADLDMYEELLPHVLAGKTKEEKRTRLKSAVAGKVGQAIDIFEIVPASGVGTGLTYYQLRILPGAALPLRGDDMADDGDDLGEKGQDEDELLA
jgi:hypothetical protein